MGAQRRLVLTPVAIVLATTAIVRASVPNVFKDGDTLSAQTMNDNFDALDQRIGKLESHVFVKGGNNGTVTCDSWCTNPNADPAKPNSGTCVGALNLETGEYRTCGETGLASIGVFCYCSRY